MTNTEEKAVKKISVEEFDWVQLTNEVRSGEGGSYEVESQKEKLIVR